MKNRGMCCSKIKEKLCAQKFKEIASLMKMHITLKGPKYITKDVLAIICSNSFSNCKADQKTPVAFTHMFSHVQSHVH